MAAGLFKVKTISYFHWELVVYLAWMSSNTHLCCLATLRSELREEAGSTRRNLRIFGMLLLAGFLAVCLVPTLYGEDFNHLAVAVPAKCLWPSSYSKDEWANFLTTSGWELDLDLQAVLSWVTLGVSYIYQILLLFDSTKTWINKWLRTRAMNKLEVLLLSIAQVGASPNKLAKLRTGPQKTKLCLLMLYLVFLEALTSFATSVLMCMLGLIWGSIRLGSSLPNIKAVGDDEMTFGQILALLLLVVPVTSVVETYWGECGDRYSWTLF